MDDSKKKHRRTKKGLDCKGGRDVEVLRVVVVVRPPSQTQQRGISSKMLIAHIYRSVPATEKTKKKYLDCGGGSALCKKQENKKNL